MPAIGVIAILVGIGFGYLVLTGKAQNLGRVLTSNPPADPASAGVQTTTSATTQTSAAQALINQTLSGQPWNTMGGANAAGSPATQTQMPAGAPPPPGSIGSGGVTGTAVA